MTPGDTPGAALDAELAELLPRLNAAAPAITADTSPEDLRASFGELLALLVGEEADAFDGEVTDELIESGDVAVPTRTWTPRDVQGDDAVVLIHGGGWVLGDLSSAAPTARALARRLRVRIVAVDYRLAPEHPFPAAFDDCLAVTRSVRRRTTGWLGVAGDSAGGNLAAAVAVAFRDAGERLDGQLLFYPALDPNMRSESHTRFADGYLLSGDAMRYYWRSYLRDSGVSSDVRMAPGLADSLAGLAPAVITTAGFDPLRDEGTAFAAQLVADGVPTIVLPQPTLIHGWVDQVARIPAAQRALADAIEAFQLLRSLTLSESKAVPHA